MADAAPFWNSEATRRTVVATVVFGVVALSVTACTPGGTPADAGGAASVQVVSWNVSSDAFVRDPAAFRGLMRRAKADILLLDEVAPSADVSQIRAALAGLESEGRDEWHIDMGQSGGRQRGVIVSRWPLERLPELADMVPYPETERTRLSDRMAAAHDLSPRYAMDGGIPVNGAVVLAGERRLLVVIIDLQCCGDAPAGWQEDRRRVETREIRRRVRQVLERTSVDGIILAGDFNAVITPLPLVIASGPYPQPHAGLIAADLRHLDKVETWTIDNRNNPFPSQAIDFLLYSPQALELRDGYVLDSADLSPVEREELGLELDAAHNLSDHRPLVAGFVWR